MSKQVRVRLAVRAGLAALVMSAIMAWVGPAAVQAQTVQISNVLPGDREVSMEWNRALGDTVTPAERADLPALQLSVPNSLGFSYAPALLGEVLGGAGAGGVRLGSSQLLVGRPRDIFVPGERPGVTLPASLTLLGAAQFGRDYVAVAFSRPVNAAQAVLAQNYAFTPSLGIQSVSLQANGQTAVLKTSAALPSGSSYSVAVSGISGADGATLTGGNSTTFQTVSGNVLNIAQIQENPTVYLSTPVTVVGQVFVPVGVRTDVPSGYIQDGSGRGINIFGIRQSPVDAVDRVAAVSGTIAVSGTTVRITGYQSQLLRDGFPALAPLHMNVRQARSTRWEGTYVETQARVTRIEADDAAGVVRFTLTQSDTSFAGYRIWRGPSPDPGSLQLLRSYSLLDTTWTFTEAGPRQFVDPDSIITRGTERDEDREPLDGPFNGFAHWYAITWFEAHIDPISNPPRAEIFDRQTIAQGMYAGNPVYPSKDARVETPLLGNVRVVPNPYNPDAAYDKQVFPGAPRIQFINLPLRAKVDIYTVAGDLVRTLQHEESDDSLDWDLKNGRGEDVAPGIYLYHVEVSGESTTGRFVIAR